MKFWDSSAVVPLLVPEVMSGSMQRLYAGDPVMVAWWATEIECTSAIARRQRLGQLPEDVAAAAFVRLKALREGWHESNPARNCGSRPSGSCVSTISAPRMLFSLPPPSSSRRLARRPWSSCHWTTVFWPPRAERGSPRRSRPPDGAGDGRLAS